MRPVVLLIEKYFINGFKSAIQKGKFAVVFSQGIFAGSRPAG